MSEKEEHSGGACRGRQFRELEGENSFCGWKVKGLNMAADLLKSGGSWELVGERRGGAD